MTEIENNDDIVIDENDETDDAAYWKELALKQQGINKRKDTKLAKLQKEIEETKKEVKKEVSEPITPEKPDKSNDMDYGQKAFLKAYGISGADELALAKSFMERTGDPLDTIVSDDIFTAKLNAMREAKAAKEAIPRAGRPASSSAKSSVEYWRDKPFEEVPQELKIEVLNDRLKREKDGTKFTSQPVIMH